MVGSLRFFCSVDFCRLQMSIRSAMYGVPFVSNSVDVCLLQRCIVNRAAIRYNNGCSDGYESFYSDKWHSRRRFFFMPTISWTATNLRCSDDFLR